MTTLTITRGLPGAGKTTWARRQPRSVRVNRDELRRMLHGGPLGLGWAEVQVTVAQRAQVRALLEAGVNVICDDTNLRAKVVRELGELAQTCGANVVIQDFTDVPLEVCIARDATRRGDDRVGEATIRDMWQRFLAGRPRPLPVPPALTTSPAQTGTAGRPQAGTAGRTQANTAADSAERNGEPAAGEPERRPPVGVTPWPPIRPDRGHEHRRQPVAVVRAGGAQLARRAAIS
ncbi:MAG TPA: AAA family ATPase [Micromonosporaceae bacterium]